MLATALAWLFAFAVYIAWRLWLNSAYGEPLLSFGGALFLLLIGALGWLIAEPPAIAKGRGLSLALALAALILLFSGELLLWLRVAEKDVFLARGYSLLIAGALLLSLPSFRGAPALGSPISRRWEYCILGALLALGAATSSLRVRDVDREAPALEGLVVQLGNSSLPLRLGRHFDEPEAA